MTDHRVLEASSLRPLLGDRRQYAGVRRFVLDDGPERGVTVLELSSGGGLDLWVMADRGLDIGVLRWHGMPVAWQSPQGFMHPSLGHVESDGGRGFGRLLSGFLATCGLDRIRQPQDSEPLHGRLAMVPARVLSAQAVWDGPEPVLRVEGECVQYRQGAENLRLHRVIEVPIGSTALRITDTVTNDGCEPQAHDLLYHFNLGYPAIGPGSRIEQGGLLRVGPLVLPEPGPLPSAFCVPHGGAGATVVLTTPLSDGSAFRMGMDVDPQSLPWLQFWRDLRPGSGMLAIEPCASQYLPGGRSAPLPVLAPGESRRYAVRIDFQRIAARVA